MTSYSMTAALVNPCAQDRVTTRLVSFYRWLLKLTKQTGFCWASNAYLADKQGVDTATITRWISRLRSAGWVRCDYIVGVERHIYCLRASSSARCAPATGLPQPDTTPPNAELQQNSNAEGSAEGLRGDSRARPSTESLHAKRNNSTAYETTDPPANATDVVVSGVQKEPGPASPTDPQSPEPPTAIALCEKGISLKVARDLVARHGEATVQEQIEALPYRNASDPAALLIAAIRDAWGLPAALIEARRKAKQEAARREHDRARRLLEAQRQREQARVASCFDALPVAEQEQWQAKARAQIALDNPTAFRSLRDGHGARAWIRSMCLELYAAHLPAFLGYNAEMQQSRNDQKGRP